METNEYEYRFKDVIDLDTREVLFTVEHETRSQTNPMYGRELINRNPARPTRTTSPVTTTCPGRCGDHAFFPSPLVGEGREGGRAERDENDFRGELSLADPHP